MYRKGKKKPRKVENLSELPPNPADVGFVALLRSVWPELWVPRCHLCHRLVLKAHVVLNRCLWNGN